MSQLIALIIAIALGAIVTAIGYVFLGDAFTSNSERGVALQLVNQGSQVEMAMTAFRATNASSAFVTDWTLTRNNNGAGATGTTNGLEAEGFLKSGIVPPVGTTYVLEQDSNQNVFLSVTAPVADLSLNVCQEVVGLSGGDSEAALAVAADTATAAAALVTNGDRYSCFAVAATDPTDNIFVYQVE